MRTHINNINSEARWIAEQVKIDRMEVMAKKQAFVTLKYNKENFENKLSLKIN